MGAGGKLDWIIPTDTVKAIYLLKILTVAVDGLVCAGLQPKKSKILNIFGGGR
jgi:hypothetical protein